MEIQKAIIGIALDSTHTGYSIVFTVKEEGKEPKYLHFPLQAPSVADLKLFIDSCSLLFKEQEIISVMNASFEEVDRQPNPFFEDKKVA